MTKSELVMFIKERQQIRQVMSEKDVSYAMKIILETISKALVEGERVEIRGFGSFSQVYHPPATRRNPSTGETVRVAGRHLPRFRSGRTLREKVMHSKAPIVG